MHKTYTCPLHWQPQNKPKKKSYKINKSNLEQTVNHKHVPLPPISVSMLPIHFFLLYVLNFPHKFIVKLSNTETTVELSIIHSIIITCAYQDTKQKN